jgi:hypothetical protein
MAGAVRQPIDIASLERFISSTVPEIKVPIDVKQVRQNCNCFDEDFADERWYLVWLWPIQPDVSVDRQDRSEICSAKEAARAAALRNSTSGRARI